MDDERRRRIAAAMAVGGAVAAWLLLTAFAHALWDARAWLASGGLLALAIPGARRIGVIWLEGVYALLGRPSSEGE
jgi:hypothetical protein